jgi:hypothetical protein
VFVVLKHESFNVSRKHMNSLSAKLYVRRKELAENIFATLFAARIKIHQFWQTILVNLIVIKCSIVENMNVANLVTWAYVKNVLLCTVSLSLALADALFSNLQSYVVL